MNKIRFKYLAVGLGLIIPYLIIYRAFFTGANLSLGDAPYFYPENLRQLINLPLTWDIRNSNFGLPQLTTIWLFLPTFLMGLLHLTGLNSDLLIRLIFYLPATLLAIVTSWLLIRQLTDNLWAKFIGSFFYGFNNYFLMIIDGGQVGFGLGYGLFPLSIWALIRFLNSRTIANFWIASVTYFLVINVDLRVALLSIFLTILWQMIDQDFRKSFLKKQFWLAVVVASSLLLSSFWVIPVVFNLNNLNFGQTISQATQLNFIQLSDSLLLFQPHFPLNEFGKTLPPPWYFTLLPILLSLTVLVKQKRLSWLVLFLLVMVFLAKGTNPPLGEMFDFLTSQLPGGVIFRDSSKFYLPMMLTASVLLAVSLSWWLKQTDRVATKMVAVVLIYSYLLLLIHPAWLGSFTGVLGSNLKSPDYQVIYQQLKSDSEFTRSIWFPETPPAAFSSTNHPAISANQLFNDRPFASMIDGSYDLFGFLNNENYPEWLRLLGVQYSFYPEDQRQKTVTPRDRVERGQWLTFVNKLPGFSKLDWPVDTPAYQLDKPVMPHFFAQNKLLVVVGGDEVYKQLMSMPDFDLANQGIVFLESCQVEKDLLNDAKVDSLVLLIYQKSLLDLAMTRFCDQAVSVKEASQGEWAIRSGSDYLKWKAELLEKGLRTDEYDFGQGIAFSTQPGEKLALGLNAAREGVYYLSLRLNLASTSAGLKINFNNQQFNTKLTDGVFRWQSYGPYQLKEGQHNLELQNIKGLSVFNTALLIEQSQFEEAMKKSTEITSQVKTYQLNSDSDWQSLIGEFASESIKVVADQLSPTHYRIKLPNNANWLTFTDHYNSDWKLVTSQPLPFYSMVNGFYIGNLSAPSEVDLKFIPQQTVIPGIILSAVSLIIMGGVSLTIFLTRKRL